MYYIDNLELTEVTFRWKAVVVVVVLCRRDEEHCRLLSAPLMCVL